MCAVRCSLRGNQTKKEAMGNKGSKGVDGEGDGDGEDAAALFDEETEGEKRRRKRRARAQLEKEQRARQRRAVAEALSLPEKTVEHCVEELMRFPFER